MDPAKTFPDNKGEGYGNLFYLDSGGYGWLHVPQVYYFYAKKFGGNYVPETLKKPIEDLTKLFEKLRNEKQFLKERDYYFKNYVGTPTPFIKLHYLTKHLGGAQMLC